MKEFITEFLLKSPWFLSQLLKPFHVLFRMQLKFIWICTLNCPSSHSIQPLSVYIYRLLPLVTCNIHITILSHVIDELQICYKHVIDIFQKCLMPSTPFSFLEPFFKAPLYLSSLLPPPTYIYLSTLIILYTPSTQPIFITSI